MLFSSLVCISGIRQEVICLKSTDECFETTNTQMCMLLLVCLPHCVITFVDDVKNTGGSVVQEVLQFKPQAPPITDLTLTP